MKTQEDEAWEEMERRQGAGGFPAKRAMAADKMHWSDCAVHNGPAYPAGPCDCDVRLSKYAETLLEETTRSCNNIDEQRALDALMLNFHKPAQEPVARVTGVYGGRFTYEPLNRAVVLPIGMALYAGPPAQEKNT